MKLVVITNNNNIICVLTILQFLSKLLAFLIYATFYMHNVLKNLSISRKNPKYKHR